MKRTKITYLRGKNIFIFAVAIQFLKIWTPWFYTLEFGSKDDMQKVVALIDKILYFYDCSSYLAVGPTYNG